MNIFPSFLLQTRNWGIYFFYTKHFMAYGPLSMDPINDEIAKLLREVVRPMRSNRLIKLDSERILEKKLGAGRQRIRAVIQQLMSEGLLVKHEGKGTYITPLVRNKYLNLICSPDIKHNDPFYNNLLVELTNFAAKESVSIGPLRLDNLKDSFPDSPTLVVGRLREEQLRRLEEAFPTLIALENYLDHDSINQIYFDHYKIGWNAVKALTEHGHQKVLHVTGPDRYASASLRRTGFVEAARKYAVESTILSGKMNFQGGYHIGETVADMLRRKEFSAVFVANDWMAVGLVQYLKEKGIRIPDDLSVIGVDNIPLASQISPSLTTFSLDVRIMVAEVFALLNTIHADDGTTGPEMSGGRRVLLTPVLIARESLKAYEGQISPPDTQPPRLNGRSMWG